MVGLVLAPIVLGVALYKLPPAIMKVLALLGQGWFAWTAVDLLLRARREGSFIEVLGGSDATLYVTLRGDATSLGLVILTITLFVAALLYVLRTDYLNGRLVLLLFVLQGLTSGIFVVDDIFTLFVMFEVATLVVIMLVMFHKGRRNTYDGLYYLVVQLVAMTFFLFGVAYLYRIFGVLSVSQVAELIAAGGVDGRALVLPFAMMLTGVGLKAGLFPTFSYVPRSYGNPGAPAIVLLLMSGVLVKGALFWIARLVQAFAPALDVTAFLVVIGLLTGVGGVAKALATTDLRLLLAYSTVAQAGLITLGLAAGTDTAHAGAILHLTNHALLKSILFLTAAMIVRRYGTTSVAGVRGVARQMPLVAVVTILAMLGMVGMPFTGGAVSKDLMMAGADGWVTAAMWVVNTGTFFVMVRYGRVLVGTPAEPLADADRATRPWQLGAVLGLTAATLAIGAFGTGVLDVLVGVDDVVPAWPGVDKVAGFFGLLAAALLAHRFATTPARRLRGPLTGALSLPQACLALTVFFVAAALFGTLTTWGVSG